MRVPEGGARATGLARLTGLARAAGPGRARLIAGLVMASFAAVYVTAAPARTDGTARIAAAVVLALGVLALHLLWLVPALAPRRRAGAAPIAALALQAACAYAGVLAFGTSVAILGFVAGSLLLRARGWPLAAAAAAVLGSAAAIDAARGGATVDAAITASLVALVVYGLVRLADRADDTAAARLPLTMAAVARERLRIAAELDEGLGEGLRTIAEGSRRALDRPEEIAGVLDVARRSLNDARAAAADLRSMSLAPEVAAARALLEASGVEVDVEIGHTEPLGPAGALLATVLREAVTDVVRGDSAKRCLIETSEDGGDVRLRVVNDGVRTAARGEEGLEQAADRVRSAGGTFSTGLGHDGRFTVEAGVAAGRRPVDLPDRAAYRLSITLLAAVLAGFSVKGLLQIPWGPAWAGAAAGLLVVSAVQLVWTTGGRPRAWPVALAVVSFAPVPVIGQAWLGVAGFLAGTLLVGLPRRAAVPLVAAVAAGVAGTGAALGLGTAATVNYALSTLVTGLVVDGLVRLARIVRDLQAAGAALARAATVQERLRAARDLHDLLGHSLAAILLKCELARRLADRDPGRAKAELTEAVEMADRARADLRTATGGNAELSLDGELRSARSVLAAAGVEVTVEAGHAELSAEASSVLGIALREAVTNVLRHSAARHCTIITVRDGAAVRLTVENDGLDPGAARTPPGSGIGNLTTRLAAHNGTLTARADGKGNFRLEAVVKP